MRIRKFGLTIAMLALLTPAAALTAEQAKPQPKPLSAMELYKIYRNKTWIWNTGGGRFDDAGRNFTAWTNSDGKQSFAEGRWTVDDAGRMCLRAKWTTSKSAANANTCFAHRQIGDTIYQRKLPDGKWYAFRHTPDRADDEFAKLVQTDDITSKALAFKQTLMAKK